MPYVDADSFTTIADVEARVQRGTFSVSTKPSTDQVRGFMQKRSAEIQALLLEAGLTYTVTNGSNPFPGSPTTAEKVLKDLCALANELNAAGDAIAAHDTTDGTGAPDEAIALWNEASDVEKRIINATMSLFGAADTRTHTSTGGIGETDFASDGYDEERTQSQVWGLGTKF